MTTAILGITSVVYLEKKRKGKMQKLHVTWICLVYQVINIFPGDPNY